MDQREEVRDVRYKKFFLLLILICLSSPTIALAESYVNEVDIGIGFQIEQPAPNPTPMPSEPIRDEPVPVDNVLPATIGETRYQSQSNQPQATSRGTLPKTGEQRQVKLLQFLGLSCLISCFWLFLFTRLREEDEHE